jgi:putative salt-induced outer membrane protein
MPFALLSRIRSGIRIVTGHRYRLLACMLLLPLAAVADTVTLKNGDRLTGSVTQLAGGKLSIDTKYAGTVTIAWDEVATVKLDKTIVMATEKKSGKKVEIQKKEVSAIERTDTGFAVTTPTGPESIAAVTALRSAAAQQSYEASLRPNFLRAWTGGVNVSFALARGNSETTTVGAGMNLVRPTSTDKTSLYYNTLYTHDGIQNETTANLTNAGLRYDHNLNPRTFAFGTLDFNTNALQDLDLRTIAGGGFGWHAIAKPVQQLDILGGVVWTHESYSSVGPPTDVNFIPALTNSFAALDFGQQYTRKLGAGSSFTEQAYIFPDLNDISQYRFTVVAGLNTKIKSFLSWQTTFSDIYVTDPQAGTKDNDVIFTTGLGFNFTRK